jgi:hypothetical protein
MPAPTLDSKFTPSAAGAWYQRLIRRWAWKRELKRRREWKRRNFLPRWDALRARIWRKFGEMPIEIESVDWLNRQSTRLCRLTSSMNAKAESSPRQEDINKTEK